MFDFHACLEKLSAIAPNVAQEIASQTKEIQEQIFNLIAQQGDFVSRQEFEKQKLLYERLSERCQKLEEKAQSLSKEQSLLNNIKES